MLTPASFRGSRDLLLADEGRLIAAEEILSRRLVAALDRPDARDGMLLEVEAECDHVLFPAGAIDLAPAVVHVDMDNRCSDWDEAYAVLVPEKCERVDDAFFSLVYRVEDLVPRL